MTAKATWLSLPAARAVTGMLESAGHQALFVGGCVRNTLLGAPVTDLDLATDARPEAVLALADAAGLKAVPTGISHGTVTIVVEGVPVEVTTFRRDVETDGRHAVVAFSDSMEEDAARRDFTMNALYMDGRGTVLDPLDGLADLEARRVRFVGDAEARVREDYLRILRFFRFHAWYGDPDAGLDAAGLAACAAGLEGLGAVSAERIGAEIVKLLGAPDPAPAVAAMAQAGVLGQTLAGADATALAPLVHLEEGLAPDPMRRLAALTGADCQDALRLRNADARHHQQIARAARGADSPIALGHRLGAEFGLDALLVRAALLGQPLAATDRAQLMHGAEAQFPVQAGDLMPALAGPELGRALDRLRGLWLASACTLGREALLSHLNDDAD